MCDFVGREGVVHEQVKEWSSSDDLFLSKEQVHNEFFVVLDNTGWLQSLSNSLPRQRMTVSYKTEITTTFAANDLYNKTFMFFAVVLGVLLASIILMACLYRLQKRAHQQVLHTKKELKRISLNRQAEQLRESLSQRESSASIMIEEREFGFND